MKRQMLACVALTVCFGLLGTANAAPRGNGGGGNSGFRSTGGNTSFARSTSNVQSIHVQNHSFNQVHTQQFNQIGQHSQVNSFAHNTIHAQQSFRNISIGAPRFNASLVRNSNYHLQFGRKFDFGYCYYGQNHSHWVSTYFAPECGCNVYYDPCTLAWYYWCPTDDCFYPVSYCPYGVYVF